MENIQDERNSSHVKSIQKAIDIILAFRHCPYGATIEELSRFSGINRNTVYRILLTLESQDVIFNDADAKRYYLGPAALQMGIIFKKSIHFRPVALPIMEELSDRHEENIGLVIPIKEGKVFYVDSVRKTKYSNYSCEDGVALPMHAGAAARTILTFQSDQFIEAYLKESLESFTSNTLTEPQQLWEKIQETREKFYAISYEEVDPGINGVAAPVFDHRGKVAGSIAMAGPSYRFVGEKLQTVATQIRDAARTISAQIGYNARME